MIKYPYIPEGRTFIYVDANSALDASFGERCMAEAKRLALEESTDFQQSTGAVVTKDGVIIGRAANQTPLPSDGLRKLHQSGLCIRKVLNIKTGTKYWMCPGCAKPKHHAEQRAIDDARRYMKKQGRPESDIDGADLYLYGHWWCCIPCWEKMLGAKIRNAYLLKGSEVLFNRDSKDNILGKRRM